jgi:hypothetical protein
MTDGDSPPISEPPAADAALAAILAFLAAEMAGAGVTTADRVRDHASELEAFLAQSGLDASRALVEAYVDLFDKALVRRGAPVG